MRVYEYRKTDHSSCSTDKSAASEHDTVKSHNLGAGLSAGIMPFTIMTEYLSEQPGKTSRRTYTSASFVACLLKEVVCLKSVVSS